MPIESVGKLHHAIKRLLLHLDTLDPKTTLYLGETIAVMALRWSKLHKDLLNDEKQTYDFSKIPDIYDSIKYDVLHNSSIDVGLVREYEPISLLRLMNGSTKTSTTLRSS